MTGKVPKLSVFLCGCAQGVMLTHANLMYQVSNLSFFLRPMPGERTLSLLPPWHIYERAVGYFVFACGVTQACHYL